MTTRTTTIRARSKGFAVRGWSMRPVTGMLLLSVQAAVPTADDPAAARSVLLTLNEAQVRLLAEQLTSELAMLRKERPMGTA